MRHQLNAILSRPDGIYQLSALTALKALLPKFSQKGPFVLTLADLHQSNLFVDDERNIVGVIDFEFVSVQPIQMTCVSSWLSNLSVEQLTGPALDNQAPMAKRHLPVLHTHEVE